MNTYSLNETATRARLAARGAGYEWGLADEVYRSVFWLVQRNLPAPLVLSRLLGLNSSTSDVELGMPNIYERHFSARGTALCPVLVGCAMTDRLQVADIDFEVTFDALHCPLLMLPFMAELAIKFDRVVVIDLDTAEMVTDGNHVRFSSFDLQQLEYTKAGSMNFKPREAVVFDEGENLQLHARVSVDPVVWQALGAFAHNTYAPATEASRNSGAGAGVSDND